MRILGIDPGSTATGFGVVEASGATLRHVAHGTIRGRRGEGLGTRLARIHQGLGEVIDRHAPEAAAVERVFVARNAHSALVLGQARGVALAAVAGAGLPIDELSASQIKSAVVGTGAASKVQVKAMVARLLGLDDEPPADAADALAAAVCRAHQGALAGLDLRGAGRGRRRAGARGGRFVLRGAS